MRSTAISARRVQDVVIVDYMVRFSPLFERISTRRAGIRVIVFRLAGDGEVRLADARFALQSESAPGAVGAASPASGVSWTA